MPYDELDRRGQFWIQRYPSVKIHAAATRNMFFLTHAGGRVRTNFAALFL